MTNFEYGVGTNTMAIGVFIKLRLIHKVRSDAIPTRNEYRRNTNK